MKVETHCHTLYGSTCGKADSETIIRRYKEEGYGAIVITNHFCEKYFYTYPGKNDKERIDFYFSLYEDVKEKGEKLGIKVFLGSEVTDSNGVEYGLIGFDKSMFYDNDLLFKLNQEELFRLSEKNGCFFFQTHPFRTKVLCRGDVRFMHGVESFNGHFHHRSFNHLAREFCENNNLIGISGTDFHTPDQPITAGIIVSEDINNEKQLVDAIFNKRFELICKEELYLTKLEEFLREKELREKCK